MELAPAEAGGDLGAPNSGFGADWDVPFGFASLVVVAPKEKLGVAVAGAGAVVVEEASAVELVFPNSGFAGAVEALLPNKLLPVEAGLGANSEPVEEDWSFVVVEPTPKAGAGFAGSEAAGFSGSDGFAPNSVDDCMTGAAGVDSAGLFADPKRLEAPDVAGLEPAAANMFDVAEGLTGSASLAASVEAGLGWNREDPKAGCGCADLLGPCESFSLSDSPPSWSAFSAALSLVSFSAGLSSFGAPNRFEDVVAGLGAKREPPDAGPEFANNELPWFVDAAGVVVGANLIGVVLGFQVWSLAKDEDSVGASARMGWPSPPLVTRSKRLRPGVLSRVPAALGVPVSVALASAGRFALGSSLCSASGLASGSESVSLSASASWSLFLAEPLSERCPKMLLLLAAGWAASVLALFFRTDCMRELPAGLGAKRLDLAGEAAGVVEVLLAIFSNRDLEPEGCFLLG